MSRYGRLRDQRGEPAPLVKVFWGGFAVSVLGGIAVIASL